MHYELLDDDLAELLRDALEHADPVPEAVHEAALSALTFRDDGQWRSPPTTGIAAMIQGGRLLAQVGPPVPNITPPGYMLFVLRRQVPSVGRFVRVAGKSRKSNMPTALPPSVDSSAGPA